MKTVYAVKKIDLLHTTTPEEHEEATNRATEKYCNGLKEVYEYCGGRLPRCGYGYSGINGNTEYIAYKVQ